jgi:hypothetical protein
MVWTVNSVTQQLLAVGNSNIFRIQDGFEQRLKNLFFATKTCLNSLTT